MFCSFPFACATLRGFSPESSSSSVPFKGMSNFPWMESRRQTRYQFSVLDSGHSPWRNAVGVVLPVQRSAERAAQDGIVWTRVGSIPCGMFSIEDDYLSNWCFTWPSWSRLRPSVDHRVQPIKTAHITLYMILSAMKFLFPLSTRI